MNDNDDVGHRSGERRSRTPGWLNGTVIAAAILAGASLVLGVLNFRQDADAQDSATRGAARLMQAEFLARYCDLEYANQRQKFPKADLAVRSRLTAKERMQVAARMSRANWSTVARAEVRIERTKRLLERRRNQTFVAPDRKQSAQDAMDADIFAANDYRSSFLEAFRALAGPNAADAFADQVAGECPPERESG